VEFLRVVGEFTAGSRRLQEMASESYANLGLIYLPSRTSAHREQQYRRAADACATAVRLSVDPHRQGIFLGMLGYIYGHLGEVQKACDAYRRAGQVDPQEAPGYLGERNRLGRCT
jgi:Tfp pilus assembly protein PilF